MILNDVIRMAKEAGYTGYDAQAERLHHFAALVAEAEADKYNTGTHTCSQRCQRYACVAVREAVLAERKACLKMLNDNWYKTQGDVADAIRARGEA